MEIKQIIIVPRTVKMTPGKLAAQVAHAAVACAEQAHPKILAQWREFGVTKVVLAVNDEDDLYPLLYQARKLRLPCFLVADAGRTEITPGTITALGIGPGEITFTDHLPLY